MKKKVFLVATVLWMILIFCFSAAPADESASMSMSVGRIIGQVFVSDFDSWDEDKREAFEERIDYPVRKAAHATEYAVLGMLFMGLTGAYGLIGRKRIIFSLLFSSAYACTDEFHQLFVSGRSGQFTDVLIDSVGAFVGIMIVGVALYLYRKKTTYR